MSFFTFERLREATGASAVTRPAWLGDAAFDGVCTDSRAVRPGQVFVALSGERFDGHAFLKQASAAGAGVVIVEREVDAAMLRDHLGREVGVLRVGDTREALGAMARAYRRTLTGTCVIGVAGSNGKTTTVRLIESVLSTRLRGTASQKSFNNEIGVPLTILGARASDEFLICEIGTNAPGEIARLASIVEPEIGVIVSIGREHLEGLGDLAGVAREEAALLASVGVAPIASGALRTERGVVVATGDAPELQPYLVAHRATPVVRFGSGEGCELRLKSWSHVELGAGANGSANGSADGSANGGAGPMGIELATGDGARFRVGLVGRHNALNALAAVAVGRRLGLDDASIGAGLLAVRGAEMRWQATTIGDVLVVNDAYNANPDSMLAGLRTFAQLYANGQGSATGSGAGAASGSASGRRVAIIGDMLELGEASAREHEALGRTIAQEGLCDVLVCIGARAALAGRACEAQGMTRGVAVLEAGDDASCASAAGLLRAGDRVLLKGSRGARLERVVACLRANFAASGSGAVSVPNAAQHAAVSP